MKTKKTKKTPWRLREDHEIIKAGDEFNFSYARCMFKGSDNEFIQDKSNVLEWCRTTPLKCNVGDFVGYF